MTRFRVNGVVVPPWSDAVSVIYKAPGMAPGTVDPQLVGLVMNSSREGFCCW